MRVGWMAVCLLGGLAGARAADLPPDKMRLYAMWDERYLYVGAKIEDPNVVGRHNGMGDPVWLDDDLEVYFDISGKRDKTLGSSCFWLGLSADEGVWWARGESPGEPHWVKLPIVTPEAAGFREAVRVHGTLNDPTDVDVGWEVEAALPWALFGRDKPAVGETWGFNVVRNVRGEDDSRYSYSQSATPPEAYRRPDLWGLLALRGDPEHGVTGWIDPGLDDVLVCANAGARVSIDGTLADEEWPSIYSAEAVLEPARLIPLQPEVYPCPPAEQRPLPPGGTYKPRSIPAREPRGQYRGERLVAALYDYAWQDDPRLPGAGGGLRRADGSDALSLHPAAGRGPWLSALRVGWHREQLQAASRAHLDLLLAAWPQGFDDSLRRAAVTSLVIALQDLHEHGQPHPEVGLELTLDDLQARLGELPDLTQQAHQAALYEMLAEFFRAFPPPLRAQLPEGPRQAAVVLLGPPANPIRLDPAFLTYCEVRFREEFSLDLLWLGPPAWQRRGIPLDGYVEPDAGRGARLTRQGRFSVLSLAPGYDDSPTAAPPLYRARLGRQTLRKEFEAAPPGTYDWLFYASWNDWRRGDGLAASLEYGDLHERAAALLGVQFDAPEEKAWVAKVRRALVPGVLAAGTAVQCPVRVVNGGMRAWTGADQVLLSYRWHPAEAQIARGPDGKPLFDKDNRPVYRDPPLTDRGGHSEVLLAEPGEVRDTVVPVMAVDDDGRPLPPGRFRLRLDAVVGESVNPRPVLDANGDPLKGPDGKPRTELVAEPNWFTLRGDEAFDVLVTVVPPEQLPAMAGTVLDVSAHARLETGRTYPLRLQARNDGARPWTGGIFAAARWELARYTPPAMAERDGEPATGWLKLADVLAAAGREAVAPGEVVDALAQLPVTRDDGTPLPADPGPGRYWRLAVTLIDADGHPLPALFPYTQTVELLPRDHGTTFWRVEAPASALADSPAGCRVVLINGGAAPWPAAGTFVTWRWYHLDGVPAKADGGKLALAKDLAPGEHLEFDLTVQPPTAPGPYRLALDVLHADGTLGSQQPSTGAADMAVATVVVTGGRLLPVALAPFCSLTAQAADGEAPGDGFDGQGGAFPAEHFPPFALDPADGLYPSGYLSAAARAPDWQREIVFRYARAKGKPNVVIARGQTIPVRPGVYARLHVLAAGVGADIPVHLHARTAAGLKDLGPVTITAWDKPPAHGELLGFATASRRGPRGDLPGKRCYLQHAVLELDPGVVMSGILLPNSPALRIVAMTLEQPLARPH